MRRHTCTAYTLTTTSSLLNRTPRTMHNLCARIHDVRTSHFHAPHRVRALRIKASHNMIRTLPNLIDTSFGIRTTTVTKVTLMRVHLQKPHYRNHHHFCARPHQASFSHKTLRPGAGAPGGKALVPRHASRNAQLPLPLVSQQTQDLLRRDSTRRARARVTVQVTEFNTAHTCLTARHSLHQFHRRPHTMKLTHTTSSPLPTTYMHYTPNRSLRWSSVLRGAQNGTHT